MRHIQRKQGDGGIDVYVGDLSDPNGIEVFQAKFFDREVGESQKDQIRKSFTRCITTPDFKVSKWTLCLPRNLSIDEAKWFANWRKDAAEASGLPIRNIELWDADRLEHILDEPDNVSLKEKYFKEEQVTRIREIHAMLVELTRGKESVSEYARNLIIDRPRGWEFLLTAEVLRWNLEPIKRRFAEHQKGLVFKKSTPIRREDFKAWADAKVDDITNLLKIMEKVLNEELPASWGLPGVSGDHLEIRRAVEILISACYELIEWETDVHYLIAPYPFKPLKETMEGWTADIFTELDSAPDQLEAPFKQPNVPSDVTVRLVFKAPAGTTKFVAEMQRLRQIHPELFR